MTWYYRNRVIDTLPEECVGFVYLITNKASGRKYVGKKLAQFTKTTYRMKTLKSGARRRARITTKVPSDWLDYYGSSRELTEDIALLGHERFHREILHLCPSKTACSYMEGLEQFQRRVLESEAYYNNQIHLRVHARGCDNLTL
jgi:hypothetical protein